mgnify:CR=1 FL=1
MRPARPRSRDRRLPVQVREELGIVSRAQADDIAAHADDVSEESVARALAIEHEIRHDLMAEVRAFAEQCSVGGGVIHLGATSMDIEDNADALRLREALDLTLQSVRELMHAFAAQIERYADLPTMKESGGPDIQMLLWNGVLAPAGTPPEIAARVSREVNAIIARPAIREQVDRQGFALAGSTPEELRDAVLISVGLLSRREQIEHEPPIRRQSITQAC